MTMRIPAVLLAAILLMASCAVFVYKDESPCEYGDDADTITIIFHESQSLLGP